MDYIKINLKNRRLYVNKSNGELLATRKVDSTEDILDAVAVASIAEGERIIFDVRGIYDPNTFKFRDMYNLDTLKAGLKAISNKYDFLRILINEDDYTDEITGEKKDVLNRIADVVATTLQSIWFSTGYKTSSTWVEEFLPEYYQEDKYELNFDDQTEVKKFIENALYNLPDVRMNTPIAYVLTGVDNGVDTTFGVPGGAIPPKDLINEVVCYLNDNINIVNEVLREVSLG